jgi:hypothetical protein
VTPWSIISKKVYFFSKLLVMYVNWTLVTENLGLLTPTRYHVLSHKEGEIIICTAYFFKMSGIKWLLHHPVRKTSVFTSQRTHWLSITEMVFLLYWELTVVVCEVHTKHLKKACEEKRSVLNTTTYCTYIYHLAFYGRCCDVRRASPFEKVIIQGSEFTCGHCTVLKSAVTIKWDTWCCLFSSVQKYTRICYRLQPSCCRKRWSALSVGNDSELW